MPFPPWSAEPIAERIGSGFTRSRDDRFSEIDQSSPDNTSIYNSDGVLAFATGAFAPGVTVQEASYKMWAIDGGLRKKGFSVNGQYYFRWMDAGGLKWYLLPTERLWMTGEMMRVHKAPYGGAFTPYTAGIDGWVPMIQTILAF